MTLIQHDASELIRAALQAACGLTPYLCNRRQERH